MSRPDYDVIVVGAGPAGLAAACAAREAGAARVLTLERDRTPGGILNQCIHSGFGLHYFGEELTGPEYAARFASRFAESGATLRTDATVLEITRGRTVCAVSPRGYETLSAGAIVLAMGCRERTRGAIAIPGDRPAGVYTAGAAQRYVNIEGYLVGRRVVILGSGDIGLIMARRMTLEGAQVLACVELMPYSGGLQRNIVQCLNDFEIPLLLSHTVTGIVGRERVKQVLVHAVDEARIPIPGTAQTFDCDTLLLSVGLIPENELTRAAGIPLDPHTGGAVVYENMESCADGIFCCGNAAQVHDLVDFVTRESIRAGAAAARYAAGERLAPDFLAVRPDEGVGYALPQRIRRAADADVELALRVKKPLTRAALTVCDAAGNTLARFPRARLSPGEMEKITLPAALLRRAAGEIAIAAKEEST